jgi:hypothetical protein
MAVICWVKFLFVSRPAAIAATIVIVPIFILYCVFSAHFYRRLARFKLSYHQTELDEVEALFSSTQHSIVEMI